MKIAFDCVNTDDQIWVNNVTFELSDGREVIVDRGTTEWWTDNEGVCHMTWSDCYIWNGEDENYDIYSDDFRDAKLIDVDVEDDAPVGYEFGVQAWEAYE